MTGSHPLGQMGHEGRQVFKAGSRQYQLLRQWIVEGVKKEFKVDSVVIKRKPTSSRPATDQMLDELAQEADLVISAGGAERSADTEDYLTFLGRMPKPTIAAINGAAA